MDWLRAVFVDPFDYPEGWFAYLALPVLGSAALALKKQDPATSLLAVLWPLVSVVLYFAIYIWLYGMSSTIGIGVMIALVVYSVVCGITSGAVRAARSGTDRSARP